MSHSQQFIAFPTHTVLRRHSPDDLLSELRAYRRLPCPTVVFRCHCGPPSPHTHLPLPTLPFLLTCLPFFLKSSPIKIEMASSESHPPLPSPSDLVGQKHPFLWGRSQGKEGCSALPSLPGPTQTSSQVGDRASSHRTPALPEETAPLCHFLSQGFQQFPLQGLQALLPRPCPTQVRECREGRGPAGEGGGSLTGRLRRQLSTQGDAPTAPLPACLGWGTWDWEGAGAVSAKPSPVRG